MWYGLAPEQNVRYLGLSNTENKKKNPKVIFKKKIDAIADFHDELVTAGYRVETYVHYDAGDSRHNWRDLIWEGDPTPLGTPSATLNDDKNGTYNSWFCRGLPTVVQGPLEAGNPLGAPGGEGDETVPTDSDQALALVGVKASFQHGSKSKGQADTKRGCEYQESYNDAHIQWAALYDVIKITQLTSWHPNDKGGT